MEIVIFSTFWQKQPKTNENLENCRENKLCTIYLNIGIYIQIPQENLGNGQMKLGLGPIAQ